MKKRLIVSSLVAVVLALAAVGCSSGSAGAPQLNTTTGQHPSDWVANGHWSAATIDPASCVLCHGSATDQTQAGGTSGVSCFACHHLAGPRHPANWADRAQHGRLGAQAKYNVPFTMQGFAACTPCHGTDYATTLAANVPSCYSCHTKAPHPDASVWLGSPTNSGSHSNHDVTDISNAPECFKCHAAGSTINVTLGITTTTPAANAEPGCFNATMCHGNVNSANG